jgi:flagellar P-ring protein precursor FlgI
MGDANSLQGGVLLQTPLMGADGKVYAVAQGPVAIGGFSSGTGGAGGATVTKNHPTVGIITGGAIVERRVETTVLREDGSMDLLLLNPDYATSVRIADAINAVFPAIAQATDSACVICTSRRTSRGRKRILWPSSARWMSSRTRWRGSSSTSERAPSSRRSR